MSYRTLYCAEHQLTALYEVLAPFRPHPQAVADFKSFIGKSSNKVAVFGKLTPEWRQRKELVSGTLDLQGNRTVDLTHILTVQALEQEIPDLLLKHGEEHLDHAVLRGGNRPLTRAVSRFLFERGRAGVLYRSKIDDKRCAALFEGRSRIIPHGRVQRLDEDFHLLVRACSALKIDLSQDF